MPIETKWERIARKFSTRKDRVKDVKALCAYERSRMPYRKWLPLMIKTRVCSSFLVNLPGMIWRR